MFLVSYRVDALADTSSYIRTRYFVQAVEMLYFRIREPHVRLTRAVFNDEGAAHFRYSYSCTASTSRSPVNLTSRLYFHKSMCAPRSAPLYVYRYAFITCSDIQYSPRVRKSTVLLYVSDTGMPVVPGRYRLQYSSGMSI